MVRRGRAVFRGKRRGLKAVMKTIMRGMTPAWTRNLGRVISGKGGKREKGIITSYNRGTLSIYRPKKKRTV